MATQEGNIFQQFLSSIGQIPGNAVNDVGNIITGISQIPDTVNNAIQNPKTIPSTLGKIGQGVINEANAFTGNPVQNYPLVGIQTPKESVAQSVATIQHAQQHPVNTALDVASLIQGANAFSPDQKSPIGETLQKTGQSMKNDVNKIQLKPSLSGAAKEQAVQDTVNNIVPGTTAEEKYANLLPTMKKLGDNIDQELTTNPKTVSIEDVKNAFMGNLSDQFRTKSLTSEAAKVEINDYINNLFRDTAEPVPENTVGSPIEPQNPVGPSTQVGTTVNGSKFVRMGGVKPGVEGPPGYLKEVGLPPITNEPQFAVENPTSPYNPSPMKDIVPQDISTKDLFDMKVGANQDYQGVLKKINAGQPLSDTDKVVSAARKTLDDIIAYEHPNVKTMTLQQSNLYDAISPLASARNANHAFQLLGTTVPSGAAEFLKSKAGGLISGIGKTTSKLNPERNFLAASEIANAIADNKKSQSTLTPQNVGDESQTQQTQNIPNHTGIVSQPGKYSMTSPYDENIVDPAQTYADKVAKVQTVLEQEKLNNPQQWAIDKGKLDAYETKYATMQPLVTQWTTTNAVLGQANKAYDLAQKVPPNLLQLNGSYDALKNATGGKYADLVGTLQYLEKTTGVPISKAKDKATLEAYIDSAVSIAETQYNAVKEQMVGGNTLNSTQGSTQTNLPQITQTQPTQTDLPAINNVNFDFGANGALPSIQ